jgi:hypothetical protein
MQAKRYFPDNQRTLVSLAPSRWAPAAAPESGPAGHPRSAVSTECLPIACVVSLAQAAVSGRKLLVSNYRYSFKSSTGSSRLRRPASSGQSKEPAMFIGLVIVIAVFAAYMMLRSRRRL